MSGWLLLTMAPSGSAMLMGLSRWRVLLTYTTFRGSSGLRNSSGLASLRHARKQPIFAQRDKPLVMAQQVCSECHAVQRGEVPFAELARPDFHRACDRTRNDQHGLVGCAYDPARRNAYVHVHERGTTGRSRLRPQLALVPRPRLLGAEVMRHPGRGDQTEDNYGRAKILFQFRGLDPALLDRLDTAWGRAGEQSP